VNVERAKGHVFVAERGHSLERLDKFVVERLGEQGDSASRSAVQRWIRAGRVTMGGRPATASDAVNEGAVVKVVPLPPEPKKTACVTAVASTTTSVALSSGCASNGAFRRRASASARPRTAT